MNSTESNYTGYLYAAGNGALGGAFLLTYTTRAIPKMMSKMMGAMMQNMMSQTEGGECDPADI